MGSLLNGSRLDLAEEEDWEEFGTVSYPLENSKLDTTLRQREDVLQVLLRTDLDNCVCHWGVALKSPQDWQQSPESIRPPGSVVFDKLACQTPFTKDERGKQYSLTFQVKQRDAPLGITFVVKRGNSWLKNRGNNFVVKFQPPKKSKLPAYRENFKTEDCEISSFVLDDELGNLDVYVRRNENSIRIVAATDSEAELVLHWGIAPKRKSDWVLAPEPIRPPKTRQFDDKACQTAFPARDDRIGVSTITFDIPEDAAPAAMCFVVKEEKGNRWLKNKGANFLIAVKTPEPAKAVNEADGIDREVADEIINAEVNYSSWTLMHRFNMCNGLLDRCQGDPHRLAMLFTWLRFSYIRQLDWQRRYNTKPRELAASQDSLTGRLADLYAQNPVNREWVRLMYTTLAKGGGNGQRIRDDILHIMHRNHLPERGGTFMEEWHQKLHNNTTPDDVPICEAYLVFLRTNGNLGEFYGYLEKNGVSKERMASYERAIRTPPEFFGDKKDNLIREFEEYLRVLKSVHSGTDMDTVAGSSRYALDGGLQKQLDGILSQRNSSDQVAQLGRVAEFRRNLSGLLKKAASGPIPLYGPPPPGPAGRPRGHRYGKEMSRPCAFGADPAGPAPSPPAAEDGAAPAEAPREASGPPEPGSAVGGDSAPSDQPHRGPKSQEKEKGREKGRDARKQAQGPAEPPPPPPKPLRDLLFLDLSIEEHLRVIIEGMRLDGKDFRTLLHLINLVLENVAISMDRADFWDCLAELQRLSKTSFETGTGLLHLRAVLDRVKRVLGLFVERYQSHIQPKAEYLGAGFGLERWVVKLFTEEIIRGSPLFSLSALLGKFDPILRKKADMGNWQIISPGSGAGFLEYVPTLAEVQEKVYERATVLIAGRITGEEEIPDSVNACITPDQPDILSHCAVRARNQHVLFATCFSEEELEALKRLQGRWVIMQDKGGDVKVAEAPAGSTANGGPAGDGGPAPHSTRKKITAPKFSKYAIPATEFGHGVVGGKSNNLNGLRGRLPDWIHLPASAALPFGVCEKVLESPENADIHAEYRRLLPQIDANRGEVLPKLKQLTTALRAPAELTPTVRGVMEKAGLWGRLSSWDDGWSSIKRVWASKWNDRAYMSTKKAGIDMTEVIMAVLVQEVVEAEYAYVIHTVNPFTQDRGEIYAECVVGLGETLVGAYPGRAFSFSCRKDTPKSPRVLAFPSKGAALFGGGIIFRSDSNGEDLEGYAGAGLYDSILAVPPREVTVEYRDEKMVWDDAFRHEFMCKVVEIGLTIEKTLGSPQDIEGAFSKGKFFVVQTRPQV
eukprot:tig00000202_g16617.t1